MLNVLPLQYFVFDIVALDFSFSIFCIFDISRLDILRLQYSEISIYYDFDMLLRYFGSIFFFSIFDPEHGGEGVDRGRLTQGMRGGGGRGRI